MLTDARARHQVAQPSNDPAPLPRIGVISNPRSHRNKTRPRSLGLSEAVIIKREPDSHEELVDSLRQFFDAGVNLIAVDGGDGTVRDVLTAAAQVYGKKLPRFAVLPSGKTNALAIDLKIPDDWTLRDAVNAHRRDKVRRREPITIHRLGSDLPEQLGFIFGSGAYARATELAQRVHHHGWVNGIAIVLALSWALLQTFLAGPTNPWRRGETIRVSKDCQDIRSEKVYLVMGTTLKRLPLGIKPFGPVRRGLKFLAVKAPPRRMFLYLPRLLSGAVSPALEAAGYIRTDAERVFMSIRSAIILDGEHYPGGNLAIGRGRPVEFVVP